MPVLRHVDGCGRGRGLASPFSCISHETAWVVKGPGYPRSEFRHCALFRVVGKGGGLGEVTGKTDETHRRNTPHKHLKALSINQQNPKIQYKGAAVVDWLDYPPPCTQINRARLLAGQLPGFCKRQSCRTMPWPAGPLGALPSPPLSHSGAAPFPPRFTLIGSQDHDVKSRPILSTNHTPQNLTDTTATGSRWISGKTTHLSLRRSVFDYLRGSSLIFASCRTIPLVGGLSRGSPVSPALAFRCSFILTSLTLIGSHHAQEVANGKTGSLCERLVHKGDEAGGERARVGLIAGATRFNHSGWQSRKADDIDIAAPNISCLELSFEAEKYNSCKGYNATRYKCAIAATRKALNCSSRYTVPPLLLGSAACRLQMREDWNLKPSDLGSTSISASTPGPADSLPQLVDPGSPAEHCSRLRPREISEEEEGVAPRHVTPRLHPRRGDPGIDAEVRIWRRCHD
ncbi:hypothetical protein PR048_000057 [Dryococelus australis]|uniref:Uncharacterized protein n=1 Tax=Dryococelus australis TaxID=614101 RepID=A0ABQ9IDK7_9NEOP|nr:hypothetical protein PR048_000057 [Dryococelus australis]